MNRQIERIIDTAQAFLGTKESPAGSNNVIFNTHYYGRAVSGAAYPWCVTFLWDVFRLAGESELFFGGGKTASSTALMNYAKQNGVFHTAGYRRGDAALFNWAGKTDVAEHIGLIIEAGADEVLTVEGNTALGDDSDGGEVMARVRPGNTLIGVYRPKYQEDAEEDSYTRFCAHMERFISITGTGAEHADWADAAVKSLVAQGIFNGDGSGNFGWKKPVTREAAAQMLYNLLAHLR
ncbi:MAG: S-layer homology domain-containing protein [Oscillospiraceae bacterium]|nr:S-layer homology domain-containing protein [Oscillospiraceae bacterium]